MSEDKRPLIRFDTSHEDTMRMRKVYASCLKQNGIPTAVQGDVLKPMDDGSAKYAPARKACAGKEPEDYKDRVARQEPQKFKDDYRHWIKCMRSHGLKVNPEPGLTSVFSLENGTDISSPWIEKCEQEAFDVN